MNAVSLSFEYCGLSYIWPTTAWRFPLKRPLPKAMVKRAMTVNVSGMPGTAISKYPANMMMIPNRITVLYFRVESASIPPTRASA